MPASTVMPPVHNPSAAILKLGAVLCAAAAAGCIGWAGFAALGLTDPSPMERALVPLIAGALVFLSFLLIARLAQTAGGERRAEAGAPADAPVPQQPQRRPHAAQRRLQLVR